MKVLDLFSGIGGFSLGLERAGMETIAFCEIEDYPRKVLAKHWPNVPIARDVTKLTYKDGVLYDDGNEIYRGSIDVICGGFPCQPHSFSGDRKASQDERDLWGPLFKLTSQVGGWGIFENVRGILSSEDGRYFGNILRDLASIGHAAEWFNISAESVGAPHLRSREWIITYPNETQLEGGRISERVQKEHANTRYSRWGKDKPGVERASNGVPFQMDRLGCLGNAVVPIIPELIGKAINV